MGTCARVCGVLMRDMLTNSEMSWLRVWRNMNSRSGSSPRLIAVAVEIWWC